MHFVGATPYFGYHDSCQDTQTLIHYPELVFVQDMKVLTWPILTETITIISQKLACENHV